MKGRCVIAIVISLVAVMLAGPLAARAADQDLPDYLNARHSFPKHHPWALFLGTGWTQEKLEQVRDLVERRELINPFTGQPFDRLKVFAFGHKNPVLEGLRIVTDHLEIHVLSSWEELEGYHFDFAICHSNGCTNAIDAQRMGIMRVDHLFALGTDWTSKDFRSGDLKGARLVFFAMKGDPIWKIPAPNWARFSEDTPGLTFSIPWEHPKEILTSLRNLLTQGRADPDRFPVIRLDSPKPSRVHAIFESYFPAIRKWMDSEGEAQAEIIAMLRQQGALPIGDDDEKKIAPFPPGGGGPGGGLESPVQSTGEGIFPITPSPDPRGGISAEIRINQQDFRSK
jgi:hypothetical protein